MRTPDQREDLMLDILIGLGIVLILVLVAMGGDASH